MAIEIPTAEAVFEDVVETAAETAGRLAASLLVWARNRWGRLLGRDVAFAEGRDTALCNAAMVAYDMGHPDVRNAINRLIPVGSVYKPVDSRDDAYGGRR